jgi:hypothetical protein
MQFLSFSQRVFCYSSYRSSSLSPPLHPPFKPEHNFWLCVYKETRVVLKFYCHFFNECGWRPLHLRYPPPLNSQTDVHDSQKLMQNNTVYRILYK